MPTKQRQNFITPQDEKWINSLLKGVNSLSDLKRKTLIRLTEQDIDELVIDKFHVTQAEYEGWAYAMRDLCESFDFDPQEQRLIIKGSIPKPLNVTDRWIRDCIFEAVEEVKGKEGVARLKEDKYDYPPVRLACQVNTGASAIWQLDDLAKKMMLSGEAQLFIGIVYDMPRPQSVQVRNAECLGWEIEPWDMSHLELLDNMSDIIFNWHIRNKVSVTEGVRFSIYFWSDRRTAQDILLDHPLVPDSVEDENRLLSIPDPTIMLDELVDIGTDDPKQIKEVAFPLREFVADMPASVELAALRSWADAKAQEYRNAARWLNSGIMFVSSMNVGQ